MHKHLTPVQSCRAVFGKHPADVVANLTIATDALERVESLFSGAQALLEKGDPASQQAAMQLLKLGRWFSIEQADLLDMEHEQLTSAIEAAETSEEAAQ